MKRTMLIIFGDFLSFYLAFIFLVYIRFSNSNFGVESHLIPFGILFLSWVLVFYMLGLYDLFSIKPTIVHLKRWFIAIVFSFIIGIFLFYFVPIFGISPKLNLFIQVLVFGILSFSSRRIIYSIFAKNITSKAIFIGASYYLMDLEKIITMNPQIGLNLVAKYKDLRELKEDDLRLKNLVIILDNNVKVENSDILKFYNLGIEVLDIACAYEKYLKKIPVEHINLSFVIKEVSYKKDNAYALFTFIIEKIFAIIIIVISLPFLLVAIIIKGLEDKGPIFIKQKRVGLNGRIFDLYKIRSMTATSSGGMSEKDGPVWSTGHDDPRITKVGKILRKLHIDEIPQMINILKGDIALVGPRPERPEFVELLSKEIPYYSFRHIVKPGFTGWAQIKYYYANTVLEQKEKFEYDLYYIKNRNIFIDFGVLLRTLQIIFTH